MTNIILISRHPRTKECTALCATKYGFDGANIFLMLINEQQVKILKESHVSIDMTLEITTQLHTYSDNDKIKIGERIWKLIQDERPDIGEAIDTVVEEWDKEVKEAEIYNANHLDNFGELPSLAYNP